MFEVISSLASEIDFIYQAILSATPYQLRDMLRVFLFAVFILILTGFAWIFYKSISKRDILRLDLQQYNVINYPIIKKFFVIIIYFIEYLLIMPIIIAFWSLALAIFILLIIQQKSVSEILFLTTALIIAIRILSYEKQAMSKDLAKLFPLISLSVFLLFTENYKLDNLLLKLNEIPQLLSEIGYFFILILGIEVVLRLFYTIKEFVISEEQRKEWWLLPSKDEKSPLANL